eukprot:6190779-Pleurochrysis_carterae.AAC.1
MPCYGTAYEEAFVPGCQEIHSLSAWNLGRANDEARQVVLNCRARHDTDRGVDLHLTSSDEYRTNTSYGVARNGME